MLATVPLVPLASAVVQDLTPDYAKAGATIPILSFNIIGPTGGTTLTSVTIQYTGTNLADLSYAAVYVDNTLFGWIWSTGLTGTPPTGTITGSYTINEGVNATVTLKFTLKSTAVENHTVDGNVTNYVLTNPPAEGTDAPPIDPAGYTIIDNTPPIVTLTAPLDNAYINTNTYTVTATASDLAGVASVSFYYSLDGGTPWTLIGTNTTSPYSFTWNLASISDQTGIKVKAVATDNAGNTAEDINTGITLDRKNPTIRNLTPPNGAYVNTTTPWINATLTNGVAGIDPASIKMTVNGVTINVNGSAPTAYYYVATGLLSYKPTLSDGLNNVTVSVKDKAGNGPTTASWSFIVDTIKPTIQTTTLIYPNGGETLYAGSTVNILWNATHITDTNLGTNPISLYYTTDGTHWNLIATNEANDGSYTWIVPLVISNTVKVNITATDLAGNSASDASDADFTITYVPVLTTVDVTASPTTVYADGFSYSTITATVLDQYGNSMAGKTVYFTTTFGTLNATSAITGSDGKASVTLTSAYIGTATVTATADSISDSVQVEFIGAGGTTNIIDMLNNIIGKLWSNADSLKNETKAIEAKLDLLVVDSNTNGVPDFIEEIDAIKAKTDTINWADINALTTAVADIEAKLDALPTFGDLVTKNWADLTGYIDSAKSDIIYAIGGAKSDILSAISGVQDKLDLLVVDSNTNGVPDFIEEIDAIKAKTDTINWADITTIKTEIGDISADSGRASWTTLGVALNDIKTEIEGIDTDISGLLTTAHFDNAIANLLTKSYFDSIFTANRLNNIDLIDDIYAKLNTITAGAQANSGSGITTFTASGSTTIYTGTKVGTVTVSISTSGIGYGESLRIRYYIDPANPGLYIQKTVVTNTNTAGWTDTAAAWKVVIDYTGSGTVNWAYSVIYPPS